MEKIKNAKFNVTNDKNRLLRIACNEISHQQPRQASHQPKSVNQIGINQQEFKKFIGKYQKSATKNEQKRQKIEPITQPLTSSIKYTHVRNHPVRNRKSRK